MSKKRPITCSRILGNFFILFVLMVIGGIYYSVVFLDLRSRLLTPSAYLQFGLFNLNVFMLLWSFLQAMLTDPGEVPPYWGFYMGDPESKRRRYCLMCHVFKPERCHHCSTCNRCVLNMDHHCPWINNCVGFYNRKYFMLLLIYAVIATYFVLFSLFDRARAAVTLLYTTRQPEYDELFVLVTYSIDCMLSCLLTCFLRFHFTLVFGNRSTIENLDRTTGNRPQEVSFNLVRRRKAE